MTACPLLHWPLSLRATQRLLPFRLPAAPSDPSAHTPSKTPCLHSLRSQGSAAYKHFRRCGLLLYYFFLSSILKTLMWGMTQQKEKQRKPQVKLNSALSIKRIGPVLHYPPCHDSTLARRQAKGSTGQETALVEDAPTSSSSSWATAEKCESQHHLTRNY